MNNGEFEKRSLSREDVESLTMSRWKERFVSLSDLDEFRKEFQRIYKKGLSVQKVEAELEKLFFRWLGDIYLGEMSDKQNKDRTKTIDFNDFYIESPNGKRILIHALNAYAPDFSRDGVLAEKRRDEIWYGQLVDTAAELGECKSFIDAEFNPKTFLETLKSKGFKVYWR
jgi:hypothetical protein